MSDYIVRATAAEDAIRAFAITSKEMVETAKNNHNTSPVVTAALGRMLSAGAMMGVMMKGDDDMLTLQIQGSGPMKGITVTADAKGNVKGFPNVADVMLPPNKDGKLDVGGAIDLGIMRVIKDMGLKEPYVGTVPLQTGEIAEDLTYYFATSEQVPSSVGLGVLMNRDNTVRQAGGFIIQLMPFAEEAVIQRLERNLSGINSVTSMLDEGKTPEEMLEIILEGLQPEITDTVPTGFACNCNKKKIEKVLISLGKKEIQDMIEDGQEIEVNCHFCNSHFRFSIDELKELYQRSGKQ